MNSRGRLMCQLVKDQESKELNLDIITSSNNIAAASRTTEETEEKCGMFVMFFHVCDK